MESEVTSHSFFLEKREAGVLSTEGESPTIGLGEQGERLAQILSWCESASLPGSVLAHCPLYQEPENSSHQMRGWYAPKSAQVAMGTFLLS